jgi:hypothetical protein
MSGYINKDWNREAILLACSPYSERHTSVNLAEWIMVI